MISRFRPTAFLAALAVVAGFASPALSTTGASETLIGDAPSDVRARLGAPSLIHAEGRGALWTYRFEDCALMVAYRDGPDGPRVTYVMSGPRRRAETPPTAAECIQSGTLAQHPARSPH